MNREFFAAGVRAGSAGIRRTTGAMVRLAGIWVLSAGIFTVTASAADNPSAEHLSAENRAAETRSAKTDTVTGVTAPVPLVAVYGQQWRQCTGLAEAQVIADRAEHRLWISDCFVAAFRQALATGGVPVGEHLHATLVIAPQRAEQLFALALDAGMRAGDALAIAGRAAPRKRGKFVEVAIASGADPTLLLTATAAGSR